MLRQALAMGADDARLLSDPAFEGGDCVATAHGLAAALRKLPPPDVVLCGRQASDFEAGQVGGYLAELLGMPLVSLVRRLQMSGACLHAHRQGEDGDEVVEVELPVVVTVTNDDHNVPRLATVRALMQAGRREIPVWGLADLGLTAAEVGRAASRTTLLALEVPEAVPACELIAGANPADQAATLVRRLQDLRLL